MRPRGDFSGFREGKSDRTGRVWHRRRRGATGHYPLKMLDLFRCLTSDWVTRALLDRPCPSTFRLSGRLYSIGRSSLSFWVGPDTFTRRSLFIVREILYVDILYYLSPPTFFFKSDVEPTFGEVGDQPFYFTFLSVYLCIHLHRHKIRNRPLHSQHHIKTCGHKRYSTT